MAGGPTQAGFDGLKRYPEHFVDIVGWLGALFYDFFVSFRLKCASICSAVDIPYVSVA